jgi:pSer/pThr/pTyr-binding forkhead associated (FHA) protein
MTLSADAPSVQVTAGADSVGRKSWNLKRPVTIVGSQRRSHIVIRGPEISRSHCVIVNTGSEVFLKDLHTAGGTRCNGRLIDLVRLADGDVVTVGQTRIEVAITSHRSARSPHHAGSAHAGSAGAASRAQTPLLSLNSPDGQSWRFDEPVSVIGALPEAAVRMEEAGAADAHALLVQTTGGAAVCDLNTTWGTRVNGQPILFARLRGGDVIEIGTTRLEVAVVTGFRPPPRVRPGAGGVPASAGPPPKPQPIPVEPRKPAPRPPADSDDDDSSIDDIRVDLTALKCCMADAWDQLNLREGRAPAPVLAGALPGVEEALHLTQEGILRLEAMLRGYLHDLTRCLEGLEHRERDLASQSERIHEERLKLYQDQAKWARRRYPTQSSPD